MNMSANFFHSCVISLHYSFYVEALPVRVGHEGIDSSNLAKYPYWNFESTNLSMLSSYLDGPEFKHHNTERLECIGETVSINCDTLGRPTPDVFLYLNETLLKQTLRNLSHHFTLDSERKFGSYICFGNNTVGTVNVTSTFKMKCKILYKF